MEYHGTLKSADNFDAAADAAALKKAMNGFGEIAADLQCFVEFCSIFPLSSMMDNQVQMLW